MNNITIHCSAGMAGTEEIRKMHKAKGWSDIGYHYVIERDGRIEQGRPLTRSGAHVKGYNSGNIGICLVGGRDECDFTAEQWLSLRFLVIDLTSRFGIHIDSVCGHRDWPNVKKACPRFSVTEWLNNDMFPSPDMFPINVMHDEGR